MQHRYVFGSLATTAVLVAALGCGSSASNAPADGAGYGTGGASLSSGGGAATGTGGTSSAVPGNGGVATSSSGGTNGLGGSGVAGSISAGGTGNGIGGSGQTAAGGTAGQDGSQGGNSGTATGGSGGGTTDPPPSADDVWLSPSGDDSAAGTEAAPLKTPAAAVQRAKPGLTIWVQAGTYSVSQTVSLKANGQDGAPIRIFAAPGDRPIIDFAAQPRGSSSARGIQISGDYWYLRGLEVINAGDNCINISGAHNTIENVAIHGCDDTGLQITANSSQASDATRAAYNTVLNCDSYENYDQQNQGENADGFAAKLYIGPGNVFRGCRSWHNADDGWDLFASNDVVVIDNCWAIANGKIASGQNNANGDGNGFKLGGAPAAGDANQGGAVHKVTNCASIENKACGFVRNNNPDVPALSMCGGNGNGKGNFCSLSTSGSLTVTVSAADAIAAKRDASGNLPSVH